ncbi:MAG: glycosyltransferase family 4 protein [Thermodesulfobacteriota bacterium]|nr:glycosyltransferase family 4 protein [Thermodesulfobacteriota bacterium]
MVELAKHFHETGTPTMVSTDDRDGIVQELKRTGVEHRRIPFRQRSAMGVVRSICSLFGTVRAGGISLVHSHGRWTTLLGGAVCRTVGVPFVHTEHNTFSDRRAFGKLCGRHVIAVSLGVKRNLVERFGVEAGRITVIHNGAQVEPATASECRALREEMRLKDDERIVSIIGRISHQKGHIYLVEALPSIVTKHPKLVVLCVGGVRQTESSLIERLRATATSLGVGTNVKFVGHRERVAPFIKLSEFTVLPSVFEGLPTAVIESLLLGRAVVATDVGGTSEVVRHGVNGLLVRPKDRLGLAKAIRRMLDAPKETRTMGEGGRVFAEKEFSMENMYAMHRIYYRQILNPKAL